MDKAINIFLNYLGSRKSYEHQLLQEMKSYTSTFDQFFVKKSSLL